ncbi:TrbC/VirB2 family protein [Pasteurella atlantica]|uniref:TrbC/VirB2 family protein n=1 Tax=Phocoenobacter atlanticus TaxID=3416742 RepID=UPI0027518F9A|nr:TrbC/VirB2 family protein [Pasteurella atlantica]MDP8042538.1 TrbC/VirB2 family protein [Pasteurella atlantica]
MKSLLKKMTKQKNLLVANIFLLLSSESFCAGLERVNELMDKIKSALSGISIVTVTVAILVAGYKVIFGGQTFREVAPILVGGVIIGSAFQIATMLVG